VIRIDWNPIGHLGPVPINWYGLGWAEAFLGGLPRATLSVGAVAQAVPTDRVPRHPDQYYELLGDLLMASVLLKLRGKLPDGALFLTYLVLFSALRFFLFFVRGDVPQGRSVSRTDSGPPRRYWP
jgi:prolipoprotein diacylglyceryltransferase